MIKLISDLPENMIGFEVSGAVSAHDYETVIIPTIEAITNEASTSEQKISLLYHVNEDFEKFELGAMWDDAKLGFSHLAAWKKIALVTDVQWIATSVKVFGFALPGQVKRFTNAELADAKKWLAE